MGDGGIRGDYQVEAFHDRGRVHEGAALLVQPAIQIHDAKSIGHCLELFGAWSLLETQEANAIDLGQWCEMNQRNGALSVMEVAQDFPAKLSPP